MFELQRLRADHDLAVLTFELANRAYFAESIGDRGDDFFEQFAERHDALLAKQEAGVGVFHVLAMRMGRLSVASTSTTSRMGPRKSVFASRRG